MTAHTSGAAARIGLGLAAIGRPAYVTVGRAEDLGDPTERSIEKMRARAHQLLDTAWALGIRYVDVARSYGFAEMFVGSWLDEYPQRRAALTIGSKWGYEYIGNWRVDAPIHERKDHALAMLQTQWPETIRALGSAPDIYLIHSVTTDSPALGDTALLAGLQQLADTGVRVGISTSGPKQAQVISQAVAMTGSPFSVVQATWNVLEQSAADALEAAHSADWFVVLKEVLANGRLTAREAPTPVRDAAAADHQTLDAFAVGAALAQPWADIVLSGAVTAEQLAANVASRAPSSSPNQLDSLSTSPDSYWRTRAGLRWS